MLPRGSNSRGARAQSPNRARGSRGRGPTSRGAPNSSSKFSDDYLIPNGPKALRDSSNLPHQRGRRNKSFNPNHNPKNKNKNSNFITAGTASRSSSNSFERDRLENAAKREQREQRGGQTRSMFNGGGRASSRGMHSTKQVHFNNDQPVENETVTSRSSSLATMNPFVASTSTSTPAKFGALASATFNPFARAQQNEQTTNPFSTLATTQSPFGAPSHPHTSIFGKPSSSVSENPFSNGSQNTSSSIFGARSNISSNAFAGPASHGTPGNSTSQQSFSSPSAYTTSGTSSITIGNASSMLNGTKKVHSVFNPSSTSSNFDTIGTPAMANELTPMSNSQTEKTLNSTFSSDPGSTLNLSLAQKIDQVLRKDRLIPPSWPINPGDPKQKSAIEAFWHKTKEYRSKVRASLIRARLLDDPDKPKKLSEAIEFRGTCEDMCPEFEKATRIIDHDVQGIEKETRPDGSMWPSTAKMVKKLARSAAGQDAPLPSDVRSSAALRRTLDYLFHEVLGDEGDLPTVHGFIWDRTRAIRRDFVFQPSLTPSELSDQVYCLERITRFHALALHQMAKFDLPADAYVEQQEVEQLGKALLSLIHAYEDCSSQGISCENEAEFRAYFILFNSHNTGIMETVQDWGWKFWSESEEIQIAISLVEALQNTWDTHGPLKPYSETDSAQNAFSRYFSIVEDKQVSYTMACFAEIHFNSIRKSALKTILNAYRKQRDQTKDWTLSKLNTYLWFDDAAEIIPFGEAYGLHFDGEDGEEYLSFDVVQTISDPFPQLKQPHSYYLVERKRGDYSLPVLIDSTVYDEGGSEQDIEFGEGAAEIGDKQEGEEESLFVKDVTAEPNFGFSITPQQGNIENGNELGQAPANESTALPSLAQETTIKPTSTSLFGRITPPPKKNGAGLISFPTAQNDIATGAKSESPKASALMDQSTNPFQSGFTSKPALPTPFNKPVSTTPFSFASSMVGSQDQPASLGSNAVSVNPDTIENQKPLFALGNYAITRSDESPVATATSQAPVSLGNHAIARPSQASTATATSLANISLGSRAVIQPSEASAVAATNPALNQSVEETAKLKLPQSILGGVPMSFSQPFLSTPPLGIQTPIPTTGSFAIQGNSKSQNPLIFGAKPLESIDKKAKLSKVTDWVVNGVDGIMDHFTEFKVEEILLEAMAIFSQEQESQRVQEAEKLARLEADQFRYKFLATKYGHRWRAEAYRKWLKRKGREARRARREAAEKLQASKAAKSSNVVEDFKASASRSINLVESSRASTGRRPRNDSLESLLDATGVMNGVHDSTERIRAIAREEIEKAKSRKKRPGNSTNSQGSSSSNHQRSRSDHPHRRSLLSDPSYLSGESRIHLMSKYDAQGEERQVSGVQTDYFRLKARGITTLPNGTPLASSVARSFLHQKRSLDGISKPTTPKSSKLQPIPRSAPKVNHLDGLRDTAERDDDIQLLKAKAKALMEEQEASRQRERKRSYDEVDDEELFARAKRIREQMDEGAQWFRKEIERSRSES